MRTLDRMASIASLEPVVRRRVFPRWSLEIPEALTETVVTDGGYWHAFDDNRSISMTSMKLTDRGQPVPAGSIVNHMPAPEEGEPVRVLPPGVLGWAVATDATQPACASRVLSGILATDGCVAIVTITCDDSEWAREVWMSIRAHGCPVGLSPSAAGHRQPARGSAHHR
jgi:hypothetical protein